MKRWQAISLAVLGVVLLTAFLIIWLWDDEPVYGCSSVKEEAFQAVCTLAGLGLDAAAAEELQKVVKANPELDVPKKLEYLSGGKPAFWREWQQFFGSWRQFAIAMLVLAVIVYWILYRSFGKPRVDIQDFDKGATDLEIGKTLAAIVQESLKRFEQEGGRLSVDIIAEPITEVALPTDIKSVTSPLTFASQVIDRLIPQKVITLSGYLHKPGDRGAGLTMVLVDKKGKVGESCTLWQKDYDPVMASPVDQSPIPYYRLAGPAATWACFHLNTQKS
jgi:hypothetical protein